MKNRQIENTIREVLFRCFDEYKDNIAFEYNLGKGHITYGELRCKTEGIVSSLYDLGCKGQNVAVVGKNSFELALIIVSAICCDMTLVPIDPSLKKADMLERIRLCDATYVLCESDADRDKLNEADGTLNCFNYKTIVSKAIKSQKSFDLENQDIAEDHVAMMMFSSGTGGKIKLASLTQKNMTTEWNVVKMYDEVMDRGLVISPMFHIMGTVDMTGILMLGKSAYVSDGFAFILDELKYVRPKCIRMVPATASWIVHLLNGRSIKEGRELLGGNLKNIRTSGAPLDEGLKDELKKYGINTVSDYGMTEVTGPVAVAMPQGEDLIIPRGTVGKVIDGIEVNFIREKDSKYGEVTVRGLGVFKGYYKDKESTDKCLVNGEFYTGDIGFIDEDGYLHIVGRRKNVIILPSGENIIPETIEKELLTYKLIRECLVYQDRDELAVKIVPEESGENTAQEISSFIRAFNRENPSYMELRNVHFVDALERTSTGKVKR